MALIAIPRVLERWRAWDSGSRQRINAYWQDIADNDPMFDRVFMTFELVFGGDHTVLVARQPLATTSALDGRVYMYVGGLIEEPAFDQRVAISQQSAAARQVSISIPAFLLPATDLLARGRMLAGIGEVSLQIDGGDYDQRLVLMRGDMTGGVSFGATSAANSSESIDITISDPRLTQSRQIPSGIVQKLGVGLTWALAQDAAVGKRYPLVYNGYPAIPCLRVLDSHGVAGLKFLAASADTGLEIDTTVTTSVFVNGEARDPAGAGDYEPFSASNERDYPGQLSIVLDFGSSTVTAGWQDGDAVNATLTRRSGTKALSVIEIMRRMLIEHTSLGSIGLNPDLFAFAQSRMPGNAPQVLCNASGGQVPDVVKFVEGGLIRSFPMISMVYEGRGLGPVVIDRRLGPDAGNAQAVLVGGQLPLIDRVGGPFEAAKGALANVFEVQYCFDPMERSYGEVLRRTPENTPACQLSADMVGGHVPAPVLECPYVFTDALAEYIIGWQIAHLTLPWYDVEWTVAPWAVIRLRRGMNVIYTDPDFAVFTAVPATITRIGYQRGQSVLGLRVWHPYWQQSLAGPSL